MDYRKVLDDCNIRAALYKTQDAAWNMIHERQCADAIMELMRRVEDAEAPSDKSKKMLKVYQEVLIPRYEKRAEKAENERYAAVNLIDWIYSEACISVEHDARMYLDWIKEKIERWRNGEEA